ncbi:MAG: acyl-CoA dehydrogenase domain-containing protein, partial [Gammaproteobacteria bacterium]|nr:acyl-CoA dehydrogenase domain-containing protein [Gammaproteobacteria bacterium]
LENFPVGYIGSFLKLIIFPLGKRFKKPSDNQGHEVAALLLKPSATRNRLTKGIYIPNTEDEQVGRLEVAFGMADEADKIEKRLVGLKKQGDIEGNNLDEMLKDADHKSLITDEEAKLYAHFLALRKAIIKVDDFEPNAFNLKNKEV